METTVFLSNRSQAVRLPKAVALPEDVKKSTLLLLAVPGSLPRQESPRDSWFDGDSVSADFMNDREQPAVQERESF